MQIEARDKELLLKGYRIVLIIWGAILASLPFYYFVCMAVKDQVQSGIDAGTYSVIRQILWGVSILTLFAVHFLRKFLLKKGEIQPQAVNNGTFQHPAVIRYAVATIISTAILESIGIYGVVLFFLGRDHVSLQILLIISATAMLVYRPKKEELFMLAAGKSPGS